MRRIVFEAADNDKTSISLQERDTLVEALGPLWLVFSKTYLTKIQFTADEVQGFANIVHINISKEKD